MNHIHTRQHKSIGYARSAIQTPEGEKALLEQISRLRATGVSMIVCEFSSGTASDREGLSILLELAKAQKIDEIVFTRFDRVARNLNVYLSLKEAIKSINAELRFVDLSLMNFISK